MPNDQRYPWWCRLLCLVGFHDTTPFKDSQVRCLYCGRVGCLDDDGHLTRCENVYPTPLTKGATMSNDERVEAIRTLFQVKDRAERENDPYGSVFAVRMNSDSVEHLFTAYDAVNARAERLDDIIEFIRTYDPAAVDDAEAKYPPSDRT